MLHPVSEELHCPDAKVRPEARWERHSRVHSQAVRPVSRDPERFAQREESTVLGAAVQVQPELRAVPA